MMLSVKAVRLESTERWAEHIATAKGKVELGMSTAARGMAWGNMVVI